MKLPLLFRRHSPVAERILASDKLFGEVAKLRYQIYCEELGFLEKKKYPDHRETDEYDGNSVHIVVRVGNTLAGYARVILSREDELPIFQNFRIKPSADPDHVCEVSRFMISQKYRHLTEIRREIFKLLGEEIMKVVEEQKSKIVYAVVEQWLLDSLVKRGFNFKQIGDGHYHMGAITLPIKMEVNQ